MNNQRNAVGFIPTAFFVYNKRTIVNWVNSALDLNNEYGRKIVKRRENKIFKTCHLIYKTIYWRYTETQDIVM